MKLLPVDSHGPTEGTDVRCVVCGSPSGLRLEGDVFVCRDIVECWIREELRRDYQNKLPWLFTHCGVCGAELGILAGDPEHVCDPTKQETPKLGIMGD